MEEFIAVTLEGIEDVTIKEVKELTKTKAKKILFGRIKFKTKNVTKLIDSGRSIIKVYKLIKQFKFKKIGDICSEIEKIKFKIRSPFRVRCNRIGKHNFKSLSVEKKVGAIIHKRGYKVNLEKPETKILVEIINDNCLIGLDLVEQPLSKRSYRIRIHNQSINACLAYAMIRLAGWNKKEILIDPFCKDGIIPIEAALYAKKSKGLKIYGFDESLNNIKNCDINAKLAGVKIFLKKYEVEWLDTLFKKETVNKIVTNPPFISKNIKKEDVKKVYKELFYQADYILKKNGRIVITSPKTELLKKCAENFKPVEERIIKLGGMNYYIIIFEKV